MARSKNSADPDMVMSVYGDAGVAKYPVPSRGRPERHPRDTATRTLRRERFGRELKEIRLAAEIDVRLAATLSGSGLAHKLLQYETRCYPPGEVVMRLAAIYNVSPLYLSHLVLRHADPDMYKCLTGQDGYVPSEAEIDAFIERHNNLKSGEKL